MRQKPSAASPDTEISRDEARIGVDVDDVLFEFTGPFCEYLNRHLGTDIALETITTADLWKIWGIERDEAVDLVHAFYETGAVEELVPVRGSVEGMERISRSAELIVVTARPLVYSAISERSVERHFAGTYSEVTFTNQLSNEVERITKSEACRSAGITLHVDDSPQNAWDCASVGIPTLVLDRPWNRGPLPDLSRRVADWHEIEREVGRWLEEGRT